MTYSPLIDKTMYTNKHSSRGGAQIVRVNVHHWGGTGGGIERLVESSDLASANYIILDDGSLIGSVPEEYRAWTSGSHAADAPAITVEIQNATGKPNYRVSAAAIKTLVALIADIAARYGWGSVTRSRVKGHREFAATACPGPYLYPRLGQIAKDAQKARSGSSSAPSKPKPKPSTGGGSKPAKPAKRRNGPSGQGKAATQSIQRVMKRCNFYRGLIDGDYGPMTRDAVRAYQRGQNQHGDAGLHVDGDWGDVSRDWLNWTKQLQRALPKWAGIGKLRVDGDYGRLVHAAVRTLQSRNGLHVDGIAGNITAAFMRKHGSEISNRPPNRP